MVAKVNPLKLEPGQMVDGWRIICRIGEGGYAAVYEVEKDGQRFALKMACLTERSTDPKQVDARARREAVCLQQLNHRHIIRLFAHGRWPDPRSGFFYIVLELVDGYTLAKWVEQTHPTPRQVVVLFRKLFDALEHMHGQGVFHRDLSLRNIMVTQEGEPVIIDFGAADHAAAEDLTDGPVPPCTPRNRSPEATRFWHANRLNPQARYPFKATDDIFALGADLYDVLTDPTPTRGEKRPPLGSEVMPPLSPFSATQGRVPQELSAYVMKLISPRPEDRYATAKEARAPLEEFERFERPEWRDTRVHPVAAQLPPEPSARGALPRRRGAWLRPAFAAPAVLVVLAAVVAPFLLHGPAQPEPAPAARGTPTAPPPAPEAPAEKPTTRPTQLGSPLPTQEERSPIVKPPDNTPTLTNGVPTPPKASRRRVLSKAARCALLIASLDWFTAGCAGVQARPDPEDCPKEAIQGMEALGWDTTGGTQPFILVDVTKPCHEEGCDFRSLVVWKDGPVTGALLRAEGKAPLGTRLDGHLWTTGDRIYGRYVRAHVGGRTVPICVELISGMATGLDKEEGSKPGAPVGYSTGSGLTVERWH